MISAELPLQAAIWEALTDDTEISTAVAERVFDVVSDDAVLPYITIGEMLSNEAGTKTSDGEEILVSIHTFTEGESLAPLKTLMSSVIRVLHDTDLTLGGTDPELHVANLRYEFGESFKDADNRSFHGVQRFRVLVEQLISA